jgi:hypothetical protein
MFVARHASIAAQHRMLQSCASRSRQFTVRFFTRNMAETCSTPKKKRSTPTKKRSTPTKLRAEAGGACYADGSLQKVAADSLQALSMASPSKRSRKSSAAGKSQTPQEPSTPQDTAVEPVAPQPTDDSRYGICHLGAKQALTDADDWQVACPDCHIFMYMQMCMVNDVQGSE